MIKWWNNEVRGMVEREGGGEDMNREGRGGGHEQGGEGGGHEQRGEGRRT